MTKELLFATDKIQKLYNSHEKFNHNLIYMKNFYGYGNEQVTDFINKKTILYHINEIQTIISYYNSGFQIEDYLLVENFILLNSLENNILYILSIIKDKMDFIDKNSFISDKIEDYLLNARNFLYSFGEIESNIYNLYIDKENIFIEYIKKQNINKFQDQCNLFIKMFDFLNIIPKFYKDFNYILPFISSENIVRKEIIITIKTFLQNINNNNTNIDNYNNNNNNYNQISSEFIYKPKNIQIKMINDKISQIINLLYILPDENELNQNKEEDLMDLFIKTKLDHLENIFYDIFVMDFLSANEIYKYKSIISRMLICNAFKSTLSEDIGKIILGYLSKISSDNKNSLNFLSSNIKTYKFGIALSLLNYEINDFQIPLCLNYKNIEKYGLKETSNSIDENNTIIGNNLTIKNSVSDQTYPQYEFNTIESYDYIYKTSLNDITFNLVNTLIIIKIDENKSPNNTNLRIIDNIDKIIEKEIKGKSSEYSTDIYFNSENILSTYKNILETFINNTFINIPTDISESKNNSILVYKNTKKNNLFVYINYIPIKDKYKNVNLSIFNNLPNFVRKNLILSIKSNTCLPQDKILISLDNNKIASNMNLEKEHINNILDHCLTYLKSQSIEIKDLYDKIYTEEYLESIFILNTYKYLTSNNFENENFSRRISLSLIS